MNIYVKCFGNDQRCYYLLSETKFSRAYIYVKMPNQQESVNVMGGFLEITGFPDVYVIGAITYIYIYIYIRGSIVS